MKDALNAPEAESGQASTDANVEASQPVPIKVRKMRKEEKRLKEDRERHRKAYDLKKLSKLKTPETPKVNYPTLDHLIHFYTPFFNWERMGKNVVYLSICFLLLGNEGCSKCCRRRIWPSLN